MRLAMHSSVPAVRSAGRRGRALIGLVVLLCIALLGIGRASATATPQVRAIAETAMAAQSAPMLSDRMPCALCYIASAPNANASNGEGKETETPTWWVHASPVVAPVRIPATDSRLDRVPIRISFCKWLD
jgi:hypothetical protein